jgi:hypothetical protein
MDKFYICLIFRDEHEYLDEWITYHKSLGFDEIIIYDNNSTPALTRNDATVIKWTYDIKKDKQVKAYQDCLQRYKGWILFIDTDEFLVLGKYNTIQEYISSMPSADAYAFYWRMYASKDISCRQPIKNYKYWYPDAWYKTICYSPAVNPSQMHVHTCGLPTFDENGKVVNVHTSKEVYIKHTWTRSLPEWKNKQERGCAIIRDSATIEAWDYNLGNFYQYQKKALNGFCDE